MAPIDGIINLDKPSGITSAKALYQVRSISKIRKSGHAGTLDPAADGVLVICVGRATKLVEEVMDQPKVYRARARLDVTSESFDCDSPLQQVPDCKVPDRSAVEQTLASFEGAIEQIPPVISAVKVGGVPAYELVRRKQVPTLRARTVNIYWIHLHAYDWPAIDFEMACGRGTYVRALIRDVGARLGTGGCLTSLTRRAVGPFRVDEAWSLAGLKTATPAEYILPLTNPAVSALHHRPAPIPNRP